MKPLRQRRDSSGLFFAREALFSSRDDRGGDKPRGRPAHEDRGPHEDGYRWLPESSRRLVIHSRADEASAIVARIEGRLRRRGILLSEPEGAPSRLLGNPIGSGVRIWAPLAAALDQRG